MLRHVMYLVGLSVIAVYFKSQLVHGVHFLLYLDKQIANGLSVIFSTDQVGSILQSVLSLLLIPVVAGVVCALGHFVLKQEHFPHTMTVIWICWAVLLVAMVSGVSKSSSPSVAQNGQGQMQTGQNGKGQMQMAQNGQSMSQDQNMNGNRR